MHVLFSGTICSDNFGQSGTDVVCRQLGFNDGYMISDVVSGFGAIHLDDVDCTGDEQSIDSCYHPRVWGDHNCDHSDDVAVQCYNTAELACNTDGAIRLQDGEDDMSGRVEICLNDQWGMIHVTITITITISISVFITFLLYCY